MVEVMIGILLVAMIVTSIFSLVLTSQTSSKKSGKKAQALFYTRQAMERLKAYVTADSAITTAPSAGWVFPGDTSGVYALQPGVHDIKSTLPAEFTTGLQNLVFQYTVADYNCGGRVCKKVTFQSSWDEEQ